MNESFRSNCCTGGGAAIVGSSLERMLMLEDGRWSALHLIELMIID
jgi:hypothetical protein